MIDAELLRLDSRLPELDGVYVYGDWSTGRIWGVKSADQKTATWHQELARTTLQISGFRETKSGDVLIMDQGGASIYKLLAQSTAPSATPFPHNLAEITPGKRSLFSD